jgi:glucose/arabinose dehydrogenase
MRHDARCAGGIPPVRADASTMTPSLRAGSLRTHSLRREPAGVFAAAMLLAACAFAAACVYPAGKIPTPGDAIDRLGRIRLPPGFAIEMYADGIDDARSLTRSPSGIVYVGSRSAGKVYAVVPRPDGRRDAVTVASGLHEPNGVAWHGGDLYVAEISRVLRFTDIDRTVRAQPRYTVVNDGFPRDEAHGWKFIAFGPDGKLYVPVGMPCNTCVREDARYGTILRMNPDGTDLDVYASGIRNTVGFAWHPDTHVLWFTDNGRDWLGDDLPPDELNAAPRQGMNFGFPYCYGKNHPDPAYEGQDCARYTPAAMELGPHVASLGMRFYNGTSFPDTYRGRIFIAEHGSWNRSVPIGYRITTVRLDGDRAVSYETFAEGWLNGPAAWGRPVDVLVQPDGSLLVSDDKAGCIYRIYYRN